MSHVRDWTTRAGLAAAIALPLAALPACETEEPPDAPAERVVDLGAGRSTVRGRHDRVEMTLPLQWSPSALVAAQDDDDVVVLEARRRDDIYVAVSAFSREELITVDPMELSDLAVSGIAASLEGGATGEAASVTINGLSGFQRRIDGSTEGGRLVFVHTVLAGPSHVYEIIGWVRPTDFDANWAELSEVIGSFRER